jgi:hypothetical protein
MLVRILRRVALAICPALVLASVAMAQAGGWIVDPGTACRVWNPHPQPNETVKWSGSCANGLAQGRGSVQWFRENAPFEKDDGEWNGGRQLGQGSQVWPSGRYDGEMLDGEPNGNGKLTLPNTSYEGGFRNGKPDGTGTLTNASGTYQGSWKDGCFRDSKRRASLGVPLSDCH